MPYYEYICSQGHEFSEFVFGYDRPSKCPDCGEIVEKQIVSQIAHNKMISGTERAPTNQSGIDRRKYKI